MATVNDTNKVQIAADGQSDVIELPPRACKIIVKYGSGAAGTLVAKMGVDEDNLITVNVPDGSGGYAGSLTADKVFEISGGGVFGFSATSVSGTIEFSVLESSN